MHQASYYNELPDKKVQCQLCPKFCVISPNSRGDCRARKNINRKLISLVYAKPCSVAVDPIEKKPLFHFLPDTAAFSIGTAGCNLHCQWCQNSEISQANPEDIPYEIMGPEAVVQNAIENNCKTIAYTYNEPTIFYEYVLETARLAKKAGIKNILVTSAFINPEPLKQLYKYIDAANIDFKGFTEQFYKKYCFASLKPVLESVKNIRKTKTWIELTNLIIPTLNDNMKTIKQMCTWIKNNLGADVPVHFTGFYPHYKLKNLASTTSATLLKAREIALETGLKYVYVGNIPATKAENTYCPGCKELLIERSGFSIIKNNLKQGKCPNCKTLIPGIWKD